jgi:hypothetical protein
MKRVRPGRLLTTYPTDREGRSDPSVFTVAGESGSRLRRFAQRDGLRSDSEVEDESQGCVDVP